VSRRPDGRRGRRKPDPAEETASWLVEIEQAGQSDEDEDDWADTLRATRREATGQFPRTPSSGQAGYDTGSWQGAQPSWGDPDPAPASREAPWRQAQAEPGPAAWQPEGRAAAEPPPPEPQAWDTQADAEAWNGRWPFEDASQSWEPDDRSYTWPSQELPSTTGSWEAGPPPPSQDPWASPQQGGYAGPPGYEAAGYGTAAPGGGYDTAASAGGYGDPGHGADAPYGSDPGYSTDAGAYTSGGYQPGGYDGSGEYPAAGEYQAGRYSHTGEYPAMGGYGEPAGGQAAAPDTSGEVYARGDQYADGRDPYATGDRYLTNDPWASAPAYGAQHTPDPYDRGGASDPGRAADPRLAGTTDPGRAAPDAGAREPYPGHDPFAAYGLQNARRYGTGEIPQAAPGTSPGPSSASARRAAFEEGASSGPISGGRATGEIWPPATPTAARAATTPTRPESWPPQTGSWGIEEPPPRPRSASSGEFSRAPGGEEEQVLRLGRPLDDGLLDPGPRVHTGRGRRSAEARLLDDGEHLSHRARWPRVVALISWIILLMVLCWFYVFPWLEKILPENF
jgi:hypothetical protein